MNRSTEQEVFWETEFGDEYIDRNQGPASIASNIAFFTSILTHARDVASVLELGSNIGMNLAAIRQLLPNVERSAVEINQKAADVLLEEQPDVGLHRTSILDFQPTRKWDLVFTKGVLIHINPDKLPVVYDLMHAASSRYVLVGEYYNPAPVEISYRGHSGRLFKRDFAGELMDRHPDLSLVDYKFAYHRDRNFPQDDITWFLMEKGT